MKQRISPRFAAAGRLFLGALALWLVAGIGAPPSAEAITTAATAIIRNTATVKYNNAAGVAQADITATSDVKVTLVAAMPTLSSPTDLNTVVGTNAVYTYYLISNANGLDTYNLTSTITSQTGISGSTAAVPASISLGASTVAIAIPAGGIAAGGTSVITVPSDDTPGSGAINGIAIGDTIVILSQVYTVANIADNGGVGTSTITVNGNGTASGAIPAGTQIGERGSFSLTVTPGTLSGPTDGFVDVNVTARDAGSVQPATPADPTTTTVQAPRLTVTKEVSIDGGATFPGGVPQAAPGATLTYRITVTNGGSSNATSVVITDPMTIFTTYQAGTAKRATGGATTYAAAPTALTDTNGDGDGFDYNLTTTGTATYNVGTVAPGAANAVQLFFQVKIN